MLTNAALEFHPLNIRFYNMQLESRFYVFYIYMLRRQKYLENVMEKAMPKKKLSFKDGIYL